MLALPRFVAVGVIRLYQATFGRLIGGRCRFHPSCSEYAVQAIRLNGVTLGGLQAVWRVVRCAPWTSGGVDHPKPLRVRRPAHD